MKSRNSIDRLDSLLTEYAIEHIDWPDSQEDLDRYLNDAVALEDSPPDRGSDLLFDIEVEGPSTPKSDENSLNLGEIVRRAYIDVNEGCSIDRLIADPSQDARFIQACWKLGAQASQYELNHLLLNARKNKIIGRVEGIERYSVPRAVMDQYLFAAEFALRLLQDLEYFEHHRTLSLDRILCDPDIAKRFEEIAKSILPGFTSLDYRWAAFSIRKGQNRRATKSNLVPPQFERLGRRDSMRVGRIEKNAGFFWIDFDQADLYIGHAENLRAQVERILDLRWDLMADVGSLFGMGGLREAEFAIAPYTGVSPSNREALKTQLVRKREPKLNVLGKGLRVA
jgi:hypothetical protein